MRSKGGSKSGHVRLQHNAVAVVIAVAVAVERLTTD